MSIRRRLRRGYYMIEGTEVEYEHEGEIKTHYVPEKIVRKKNATKWAYRSGQKPAKYVFVMNVNH